MKLLKNKQEESDDLSGEFSEDIEEEDKNNGIQEVDS